MGRWDKVLNESPKSAQELEIPRVELSYRTVALAKAICECGGELMSSGSSMMRPFIAYQHVCHGCKRSAWFAKPYPHTETQ